MYANLLRGDNMCNIYDVFIEDDVLWIYSEEGPLRFECTKEDFKKLKDFLVKFMKELPKLEIDLKTFKELTPEDIARAIKERADKMDFKN